MSIPSRWRRRAPPARARSRSSRTRCLPQVLPQLADITIYRWEYHFRASAVLGIVGAGGIGFELIAALRIIRLRPGFGDPALDPALRDRGGRPRRLAAQAACPRQPRILVTNWVHAETLAQLSAIGVVDANPIAPPWPRAELQRRADDADAILAFMPDCIDRAFLAHCRRLRIVACALKGYDNFDVEACTESGVWVTHRSGPADRADRGARGRARDRLGAEYPRRRRAGPLRRVRRLATGAVRHRSRRLDRVVVGMGRVGRAMAKRLAGFGCRILGVDPAAELPAGVIRANSIPRSQRARLHHCVPRR